MRKEEEEKLLIKLMLRMILVSGNFGMSFKRAFVAKCLKKYLK
jgi:hypothetical protein